MAAMMLLWGCHVPGKTPPETGRGHDEADAVCHPKCFVKPVGLAAHHNLLTASVQELLVSGAGRMYKREAAPFIVTIWSDLLA